MNEDYFEKKLDRAKGKGGANIIGNLSQISDHKDKSEEMLLQQQNAVKYLIETFFPDPKKEYAPSKTIRNKDSFEFYFMNNEGDLQIRDLLVSLQNLLELTSQEIKKWFQVEIRNQKSLEEFIKTIEEHIEEVVKLNELEKLLLSLLTLVFFLDDFKTKKQVLSIVQQLDFESNNQNVLGVMVNHVLEGQEEHSSLYGVMSYLLSRNKYRNIRLLSGVVTKGLKSIQIES